MARSSTLHEIVEGMARALWVTAYADWADEHADEDGVERAGPGEDWNDVAPATPKAADQAATELADLFEKSNSPGYRQPITMDVLYTRAHEAMTGRSDLRGKKHDAETFGWYMAMQALGHGVSWFDDFPEFEVAFPTFECWFDGDELQWSGSSVTHGKRPRGNPSKRLWLVLMVNTDPSDTYAVPLASQSDEDVKSAIHEAIDLALPDDKDSLEYTVVEASDAGDARLPTRQTMSQTWKLYKGRGRPTTNPPNPSHWPSSHVQSILFDTAQFSVEEAKHWAKEHGYHYGKVDTTLHYHRLRQEAPMGGPCRTIEFGTGIKAIVCASGGGHARPPGVPGGH